MREGAMTELVAIVRGAERLRSTIPALQNAMNVIAELRVLMPDLAPELDAAADKTAEVAEHLLAANEVLSAKMDNWEP